MSFGVVIGIAYSR